MQHFFYIRCFIIQPLFLILFIPAFFIAEDQEITYNNILRIHKFFSIILQHAKKANMFVNRLFFLLVSNLDWHSTCIIEGKIASISSVFLMKKFV
jgi:hypothetical protein